MRAPCEHCGRQLDQPAGYPLIAKLFCDGGCSSSSDRAVAPDLSPDEVRELRWETSDEADRLEHARRISRRGDR